MGSAALTPFLFLRRCLSAVALRHGVMQLAT